MKIGHQFVIQNLANTTPRPLQWTITHPSPLGTEPPLPGYSHVRFESGNRGGGGMDYDSENQMRL